MNCYAWEEPVHACGPQATWSLPERQGPDGARDMMRATRLRTAR
jgi:hypothetical protein